LQRARLHAPRNRIHIETGMSIYIFLTVVQAIIGLLLVGVILMQKSEGGGLGVGGSPGGLMSARGAADFLTRTTAFLATIFVILSIALAAIAASTNSAPAVDTSLDRSAIPAASPAATASPAASPAAASPAADPLGEATKQ
jgi:preprotein translocase subunit SecG